MRPERALALIEAVRAQCAADPEVGAALMYGSFARDEGDAWSDVEFWIFVRDAALPDLDPATWIGALERPAALFRNEFETWVAILPDLQRAEFHFAPHSAVDQVRAWVSPERQASSDDMIVLDRDGALRAALVAREGRRVRIGATAVQACWDRLLNWHVLGWNVLQRGERLRALDALGSVQRHLLWLVRAREDATDHWLTPSRAAEAELSSDAIARFASCVADLEPGRLESAYAACLQWGRELVRDLVERHGEVDERSDVAEAQALRLRDAADAR